MDAAVGCSSLSQAARYGVALLFVSVLIGCATVPGGQPRPWNAGGPPRTLAAMSDSPTLVGQPTDPTAQGYNVPGRNPASRMHWDLFLGGASHRLIAYIYGVRNPESITYYNTKSISYIVDTSDFGDASLLLPDEGKKCPDITDTTRRLLFEIKPWHERGLREGREEVRVYLAALEPNPSGR